MKTRNEQLTCSCRAGTIFMLALISTVGMATTVSAAPIIMSPEPVFNFGEQDNDQKVSHAFIIKNAGDEPLEIQDVKTSCGCTVADLETNTLAPGQQTRINATFNLKGRHGDQQRRISVLSNDPEQPVYYVEFQGKAVATISLEPNIINLGRIEDSESHSGSVTLRSTKEGHTFEIEKLTVDDAVPFTTELETVVPGKEYKISVITDPNLMAGTVNGQITILTNDPLHRAFTLNVFGHVIGPLHIQPDMIRIQANNAPDARPASQNVRVVPGRVKDFELLEVIVPVESMKAELVKRQENDYYIKLSEMPVDTSLAGKELIVRTNLPAAPEVRIPFQVRPAPNTLSRVPARAPQRVASPPARPVRPTPVPAAKQ